MSDKNYPVIAREAWLGILLLLLVAILLMHEFGFLWSVPLWLFILVIFYLFRDPEREVPSEPLAVVSPVDGIVVSTGEKQDPFLGRKSKYICLKMNVTGIFSIRAPIEGQIEERWILEQGIAYPGNGEICNRIEISSWIKSDEGDEVVMSLRKVRRVPRCYAHEGERVGQGQRCGYQPFGGIVDIYLDDDAYIVLSKGDRVFAGKDILAMLRHEEKSEFSN